MRIEIYPVCQSREVSSDFLDILSAGWNEVAQTLRGIGVGKIAELETLEISLLDDREMARLHNEFLGDPAPTDVITFEHGEILIGVEVAARQAEVFKTSADREIALYGIHGMLHLAGFDDLTPEEAKIMADRQEGLVRTAFHTL